MKTAHVLLEEIKDKHPKAFDTIEEMIQQFAKNLGIETEETGTEGEHPKDPPNNP